MAQYSKPTKIPRWADTGVVVEPSEAKKDSGWVAPELPPDTYFNWHQNLVGQWSKWIDERHEDVGSADEYRIHAPDLTGTDVNGGTLDVEAGAGTGDGYSILNLKAVTGGQGAGAAVRTPESYLSLEGDNQRIRSYKQLFIQNNGGSSGTGIIAFSRGGTGSPAIYCVGDGIGAGLQALGGSTAGDGVTAVGGTGGNGVRGTGNGAGTGVLGYGGSTGNGIVGFGGSTTGYGVLGEGSGDDFAGVRGYGGADTTGFGRPGVEGQGTGGTTTKGYGGRFLSGGQAALRLENPTAKRHIESFASANCREQGYFVGTEGDPAYSVIVVSGRPANTAPTMLVSGASSTAPAVQIRANNSTDFAALEVRGSNYPLLVRWNGSDASPFGLAHFDGSDFTGSALNECLIKITEPASGSLGAAVFIKAPAASVFHGSSLRIDNSTVTTGSSSPAIDVTPGNAQTGLRIVQTGLNNRCIELTRGTNNADLRLGAVAGDPTTVADGDLWYNSTTGKFRGRANGISVDLH